MKKVAIVGGGLVGLAVGYKLSLLGGYKVTVFEKEAEQGMHQSGRNSGVIHCGLSYEPKSLKARLAHDGTRQMKAFCEQNRVNFDICGKVMVASDDEEVKLLEGVARKGELNGLQGLRYLTQEELKLREPFVKAQKALLVPEEGIIDYKGVMQQLVRLIKEAGHDVFFNSKIEKLRELNNEVVVFSNDKEHSFDLLVNCAGLYSDVAYNKLTGNKRPLRIVPFRGEYMKLKPEFEHLVNHLVYPVPNPKYPFLGVHFTRMIGGTKEVGPNAVFALKREGYTNKDISFSEMSDSIFYKGFHKFILKNFGFAMGEFASSLSAKSFITKAKKLIPDVELNMIEKGVAGVRAQAMDSDGTLVMDFRIEKAGKQVHVLNAPSPGATSSLAIADYVIENYIM